LGKKVLYRAQEKQAKLHQSRSEETLYGGAAGGGKTESLIWDAYSFAFNNPGIKILYLRRTYPELEKSVIFRTKMAWFKEMGKYNDSKKRWEIYTPSGISSWLEFGHCKNEDDVFQYQSAEYEGIYIDELTHFSEFQYLYLKTRLRTAKNVKVRMRCATNPGNIGHAWVRRRWNLKDRSGWGKPFKAPATDEEPNPAERLFIPAVIYDNKILMQNDPTYIDRLRNMPANERKQLLEGDWESFGGQAFPEFNECHKCAPFEIPKEWDRWASIDFGFSSPMSCHWHTQDPATKRIYTYRELYGSGMRDVIQAQKILMASVYSDGSPERLNYVVADPHIWDKKGNGTCIADVYATNGLVCIKANNERVPGKLRVHDYLSMADDGKPWWVIFNNCTHLIRTLPELILDPNNGEDINTRGEDHAYDDCRYFFMSKPSPKPMTTYRDVRPGIDPASRDEHERIKKMFLRLQNKEAICHGYNECEP